MYHSHKSYLSQSHLSALSSSRTSPSKAAPNFCKLLAMVVVLALCAVPGMAATLTVTSLADDGSPGTLRSAIGSAVSGDTINFGVTGTITLDCTTYGFLEINKDLTIAGPGATSLAISGDNLCRVFYILYGFTVTISGITIEDGRVTFADGGGIYNAGTLTVRDSRLLGNYSGSDGGGIFNDQGTVTVSNSTLSGNSGSGISNTGTLTVSKSTLSGNSGWAWGGGIFNGGGTVTVSNSTLSDNSVPLTEGGGGGIANLYGTLTVSKSTLSGNSTDGGGGGISNTGNSTATVSNSTLSGNSSIGGGGIENTGNSTLTVSNSTLSGNSIPLEFEGGGGGIANGYGAALTVKGTIVASSAGGNCNDGVTPLTSYGYNLSDDGSCATYFNQATDKNNTTAGLDPNGLQNNGGPTKTIALVYGSAALDAIPTNYCTDVAGNPVPTDQRGIVRPQGPACDIGAFEWVYTVAFASFTPKLYIFAGPPPGFGLNAAFTLPPNPIFPLPQPVTLSVGSYFVTVPAASFKQLARGAKTESWVYSGTIDGVTLSMQISPTNPDGTSYSFKASATGVTPATSNPIPVTLMLDGYSSTALVTARFQ